MKQLELLTPEQQADILRQWADDLIADGGKTSYTNLVRAVMEASVQMGYQSGYSEGFRAGEDEGLQQRGLLVAQLRRAEEAATGQTNLGMEITNDDESTDG